MTTLQTDPRTTPASRAAPAGRWLNFLGVDYWHRVTADGGDLYLTRHGLPFHQQLDPSHWHGTGWFDARRQRLPGTSVIYRVPTRPVAGRALDLVVRYSRVGERVPAETQTLCGQTAAEFNSPFEEFAVVQALRQAPSGPGRPRLLTKRPLAIYSPAELMEPWQSGRLPSLMDAKRARHPELPLDIRRPYLLLYGWIKGMNALEAARRLYPPGAEQEAFLAGLTRRAIGELAAHGFRMLDIKPQHILVRLAPDGTLLCRRGRLAGALVDYELLQRIPHWDGPGGAGGPGLEEKPS